MKINSAPDASIIVNSAVRSHARVWKRLKDIENYIVHSEKPFNNKDLEEAGTTWKNNWNFGRGRAQVEQGVLNNTTDVIKSLAFLEIEFELYNSKKHKDNIYLFLVDQYIKKIFYTAIENAFIDIVEDDDRTHPWISSIEYQSFLFGYCPIIRDASSYLGNPVPVTDVAFEDKTVIGQYTTWVVFDSVKAETLYSIYLRNKDSNEFIDGYIKEGLFDVLRSRINELELKKEKTDQPFIVNNWEDIQKCVDIFGIQEINANINNIAIAKIFNIEPDNSIVETYIVVDSFNYEFKEEHIFNHSFVNSASCLLFQKIHRGKSYSDFLLIVKEYGLNSNMYISELQGAGKFIAEDALRYDINRNSVQDKLLFAGSPWVHVPTSLMSKKAVIKPTGAYIMVEDDNVAMLPNQSKFDLADHVNALQIDDRQHKENVFHYNPRLDLSSRPTKDEVSQKGNEVTAQKRAKSPIKLADYSKLFYHALIDLASREHTNIYDKYKQKCFFDKIKEYISIYGIEVTDEQIKKICKSVKSVNLSPANSDPQAIMAAVEIASSSESRRRLQIMYLLAIGFSRRSAVEYVEVQEYGNEIDKASMENTQFYQTSEVSVGRNQDSIAHLNIHFAKMDRVLKGVVGGEDPVRGFNFLTNALVNTGKHIELIQSNPFFKKKTKEFLKIQDIFERKAKQLGEAVKQLQQQEVANAEQQQSNQQQQGVPQKVLQDLKIKEYQMMEKLRRSNILADETMKRRREMADLDKELRTRQAETGIQISKEMADLRKELELAKVALKELKNV